MMQTLIERAGATWTEALAIWQSGGWAMWPLAAIAVVMFGLGCHIWLCLREKQFDRVPEATWRRWIERPRERSGPIGELLETATSTRDRDELSAAFRDLHMTETVPFDRDLKIMKICVSAAPLVGLLGTVTGMLNTFGALATGSGGDKTMAMVASGISEALVTTETGLVIALPGLFFQYQLVRQHEHYKAFLAHLQTVSAQTIHHARTGDEDERVRRAAVAEVARRLRAGLASLGPPRSRPGPSDEAAGDSPRDFLQGFRDSQGFRGAAPFNQS
jgi:biopolymer transport protein ExbB